MSYWVVYDLYHDRYVESQFTSHWDAELYCFKEGGLNWDDYFRIDEKSVENKFG